MNDNKPSPSQHRTHEVNDDSWRSPNSPASPSLSLSDAQRMVDDWIQTIGVRYFDELTNLAQLVEEVGEVSRIISRTYGQQSWKADATPGDLSDELADVLFVTICLANQTGIDLTAALQRNLEKKSIRDFDRHRNNKKLSENPIDDE